MCTAQVPTLLLLTQLTSSSLSFCVPGRGGLCLVLVTAASGTSTNSTGQSRSDNKSDPKSLRKVEATRPGDLFSIVTTLKENSARLLDVQDRTTHESTASRPCRRTRETCSGEGPEDPEELEDRRVRGALTAEYSAKLEEFARVATSELDNYLFERDTGSLDENCPDLRKGDDTNGHVVAAPVSLGERRTQSAEAKEVKKQELGGSVRYTTCNKSSDLYRVVDLQRGVLGHVTTPGLSVLTASRSVTCLSPVGESLIRLDVKSSVTGPGSSVTGPHQGLPTVRLVEQTPLLR